MLAKASCDAKSPLSVGRRRKNRACSSPSNASIGRSKPSSMPSSIMPNPNTAPWASNSSSNQEPANIRDSIYLATSTSTKASIHSFRGLQKNRLRLKTKAGSTSRRLSSAVCSTPPITKSCSNTKATTNPNPSPRPSTIRSEADWALDARA